MDTLEDETYNELYHVYEQKLRT